jgi:hypothetical protein
LATPLARLQFIIVPSRFPELAALKARRIRRQGGGMLVWRRFGNTGKAEAGFASL